MFYPDLLTTKTISKHLEAFSSVFSWHEKTASTGTSRPIFASQANSNGLAQSNDRAGESQCHWCCHGRLLLVQTYGGRTHSLRIPLWPRGQNVQKSSCWVLHEQFSSNRMWYKLVLNPVDDTLALLRGCDMLLQSGKESHVLAMTGWEFLYLQYSSCLCQRTLGLYSPNKIPWCCIWSPSGNLKHLLQPTPKRKHSDSRIFVPEM